MPSLPALRSTQRFVYRAITLPGADEPALKGAKRLVTPSKTLTSEQRLGVYRDMYLSRMYDALASDYPYVEHFLGDRGFYLLISAYVEQFPSRSYTLNRLGDHFPHFIATADLRHRPFLHDLAKLELQMTQVFDETEAPRLDPKVIRKIRPQQWETAVLRTIPALRLIECDYPSSPYIDAVRDETPLPPLRKKKNYVAVHRRNFQVFRSSLPRPAFKLLSLLRAGTPLGAAIESVCLDPTERVSESQLAAWFQQWMQDGLFHSIEKNTPTAC